MGSLEFWSVSLSLHHCQSVTVPPVCHPPQQAAVWSLHHWVAVWRVWYSGLYHCHCITVTVSLSVTVCHLLTTTGYTEWGVWYSGLLHHCHCTYHYQSVTYPPQQATVWGVRYSGLYNYHWITITVSLSLYQYRCQSVTYPSQQAISFSWLCLIPTPASVPQAFGRGSAHWGHVTEIMGSGEGSAVECQAHDLKVTRSSRSFFSRVTFLRWLILVSVLATRYHSSM